MQSLVETLQESYRTEPRGQFVELHFLPSTQEIVAVLDLCLEILYPGYFNRHDLTRDNIADHLEACLGELHALLEEQVEKCLCYGTESQRQSPVDVPRCRFRANRTTCQFLEKLPEVRQMLVLDAQAALDGDPAASNIDEVILAYPGFFATTVYRLAHELYLLGVPIMPRIMSEYAHSRTGADIHPGARIGKSFFLDHATGAVIGETSWIGDRVRLYQGVTLGAITLPRDSQGRVIREQKRHPTVEDDVTIYANATVLGGQTVIGKGSVIGGSVFLTRSIPPRHRVSLDCPSLKVLLSGGSGPNGEFLPGDVYFEI